MKPLAILIAASLAGVGCTNYGRSSGSAEDTASLHGTKVSRQKSKALAPPGEQSAMKLRRGNLRLDYLLAIPSDYEEASGRTWPVLLFLHGMGERGSNPASVKRHGPPKLFGSLPALNRFIVVSPQCPAGSWWSPQLATAALDEVAFHFAIDPKRVYITGLSMGGYGTWHAAMAESKRFAAAIPICGGGDPRRIDQGDDLTFPEGYYFDQGAVRKMARVPVWAFHGANDREVPLAEAQLMVDALVRAGGSAKLTVYPDAGHDAWTRTYANPEIYAWLLSKSR